MNKPFVKWSPAVPIRKADNLISFQPKEGGVFQPSYENDPKENMSFLMSHEYMRLWFKEKAEYEKDTYTRQQIIKEESKIKRRIIQRMMTYRRPSKNQFIDDYVQRKTGQIKEPKEKNGKEKMKFKPECTCKLEHQIKVKEKSRKHEKGALKLNKSNPNDEDDDDCQVVMCSLNCEQNN